MNHNKDVTSFNDSEHFMGHKIVSLLSPYYVPGIRLSALYAYMLLILIQPYELSAITISIL